MIQLQFACDKYKTNWLKDTRLNNVVTSISAPKPQFISKIMFLNKFMVKFQNRKEILLFVVPFIAVENQELYLLTGTTAAKSNEQLKHVTSQCIITRMLITINSLPK